MSNVILKVEHISKQYRLGLVGTGTLSHDLKRWFYKIRGKEDPYLQIGDTNDRSKAAESDYVWAIKDINFEVKQGEVLGIIGKNGAGKSTLLKILSRVTSPTTGQIKTKGRIASLLEVGTGFHPELTGKENIYLNGAILGMTKAEIKTKEREIIEFSGCERYIDTPVKRYSSGMRVRLAFAVAAFLEPDILVVDEVLAVGDAEFQKKAIGKMQDISKGDGRTVLFVSHNMAAVKSLCTRAIVLEHGKMAFRGSTDDAVDFYLSKDKKKPKINLSERVDRFGNGKIKLTDIKLLNENNNEIEQIISGEQLRIKMQFQKNDKDIDYQKFFIGINFKDEQGQIVLSYLSDEMASDLSNFEIKNEIVLVIPNLYIRAGLYNLRVQTGIGVKRDDQFDTIENAELVQVLPGKIWKEGIVNRPGSYAILPGEFKPV